MTKSILIVFSIVLIMFSGGSAQAGFGKVDISYRGEINYFSRFRMEKWDLAIRDNSLGNKAFKKGEMVNNMLLGILEIEANSDPFTLFFRGEAFYDQVFDDSNLYSHDIRTHAAYDAEPLDLYLETKLRTFTARVGRQVVQWGQSIAPIEAVAVNVINPYDLRKATAPGYTTRDYQIPTAMAWASYEPVSGLSFEGVYSVDFDPRKGMPVVGTFGSFTDILGYGTVDTTSGIQIVDNRPKNWEDMKEYGFAVKKTFPSLNNFELGLYYYKHFNRAAILNFNFSTFALDENYDKIDMYGLGFSQAIDAFDLFIQLGGEIAYRPNDLIQLDQPLLGPGGASAGGWEECGTTTWNLSFMRLFSDVFPFTPWTFGSTVTGEVFGKVNMDYDDYTPFTNDWKNSYWYNVSVPFTSSDMLDNWTVSFGFNFRGALHKKQNSLHNQSFTVSGKYGNDWSVLWGYYLKGGAWQDSGSATPDRDEMVLKLTYYF
jgi:hypothetical protein